MTAPRPQLQWPPVPPPDADFRARLRAEFTRGTFARTSGVRSTHLPPTWSGARAWLPLAAAASVALFAFGAWSRDGSEWRVDAPEPGAMFEVDGRAATPHTLRAGARVRVRGGTLDLEIPGVARLQAAEGAEFRVPPLPGGWTRRTGHCRVEAGEVRLATAPGDHGRRLVFELRDASATVTGTVLAVIVEPERSCVCVLDGAVVMRDSVAGATRLAAGLRRSVGANGRDPRLEPILPMERMKLEMLRDGMAR